MMSAARILVVEEENIIAMDLEVRLRGLGYIVVGKATNGREALGKVETLSPDLVLMDIVIKGDMDGIQTAEQIRTRFGLPVVYLTAYGDEKTLTRATATAPFGYVLKPFEDRELRSTIEVALYRHNLEKKLEESESKFRLLAENARDLIFRYRLLPTRAFEYVSPSAATITGYAPGEFYADPDLGFKIIHPDDRQFLTPAQDPVGFNRPLVLRWIRKDSQMIWMEQNIVTLYDEAGNLVAVEGVMRDVTERQRAQEALKQSEAKFRTLFETMPQGVIYQDAEGRITLANPAAERILGLTLNEMNGSTCADPRLQAVHEDGSSFPTEMHPALVALRTGEEVSHVVMGVFNPQDETYRWVSVRAVPQCHPGEKQPYQVYTTFEDHTERKQAEDALRRFNAELQAHNEELDAFAHTVAHDLKNPLSSLTGFADTLLGYYETMSEEEKLSCLKSIIRNGHKLANIIDELLLLASVRKEQVRPAPLDMGDIVAEARQRLAHLLKDRPIEIVVPSEWPRAIGHPPWVEEVWVNYLSNAIKYGLPQAEAQQAPRIELGADTLPNGMVRFWVRDNGVGLTPDEQARLFTPFTQLRQVRAKGHGLGLSIVRRIVEKLGGQVAVESEGIPGRGCVLSFTLPGAAEARTGLPSF
jgi:PAS domain S-box-containing protein